MNTTIRNKKNGTKSNCPFITTIMLQEFMNILTGLDIETLTIKASPGLIIQKKVS